MHTLPMTHMNNQSKKRKEGEKVKGGGLFSLFSNWKRERGEQGKKERREKESKREKNGNEKREEESWKKWEQVRGDELGQPDLLGIYLDDWDWPAPGSSLLSQCMFSCRCLILNYAMIQQLFQRQENLMTDNPWDMQYSHVVPVKRGTKTVLPLCNATKIIHFVKFIKGNVP